MTELALWWWGEDEAPGLGAWVERVCAGFEARESGVTVIRRLLRHDQVLPGFPTAARAGTAPDLHFFWNGIYLIENVWDRLVRELDDLIPPDELDAIGGGPQSRFRGRTYRAGWYVIPVVWVANRSVLDRAGVKDLPETWEQFLEAAGRVQKAGAQVLTVGDGEGDFSVWWLTHFLTQALDSPGEACRLILGELDWREESYCRHWSDLAAMHGAGFLDEGALPLTLWEGLERFNRGGSAFTLASGPMFAGCRRALGEAATIMVAPRAANGVMAGLPIIDTQGLGVSAASAHPELAGSFLRFLHEDAWRRSLWDSVRLFPADVRWSGPTGAADPDYARMWQWHSQGAGVAYIPNLMPLELHYRLAAELGQDVLAGRLSGRDAGKVARTRSAEWVQRNPDRARLYGDWVSDVVSSDAHAEPLRSE